VGFSERFSDALEKLLGSFTSYVRVQRSPDDVAEVGRRRADLEDARVSMKTVRQQEGLDRATRREPTVWVERGRGRSATRLEKSAAFVAIALFLVILFGGAALGVYAFRSTNSIDVLELSRGGVTASLDESRIASCVWTIGFELLTEAELGVEVLDVAIDPPAPVSVVAPSTMLRPQQGGVSTFGWIDYKLEQCPQSADDVEHGALTVTYTIAGSTEELTKSFDW